MTDITGKVMNSCCAVAHFLGMLPVWQHKVIIIFSHFQHFFAAGRRLQLHDGDDDQQHRTGYGKFKFRYADGCLAADGLFAM